jgi:hypothetical protein
MKAYEVLAVIMPTKSYAVPVSKIGIESPIKWERLKQRDILGTQMV